MPETTPESEALGFKYASGKECYPALLTAGDILRQTRRSDFDPARSAFFMGAADGPCRFGQYGNLHRMLLDEQGFQNVALYILDQDDTFTQDLRMAGGRKFEWNAWMGICATDALEQLARQARPYEIHPGSVNDWFQRSVENVCEAIAAGRPVRPVLLQARAEYDRIETVGRGTRPLILVVGEMYVRINRYANDGLFEQIERLGGEVAMPPLGEWVHYSRMTRARRKRMRRDFAAYLGGTLRGPIQTAVERRICRTLGVEPTPPIRHVLELARPYVHDTFEGEAILTVGKSVEMIRHNRIAGIVHTMPFTCMPGTIASALLQRVQDDHGGIPVLNLAFTGQKDLANRIRLEAFLHQARAYRESHR
ncbi:MAG: hypothetical protein N3D11_01700 [Candidatus Sumerlaeia bacterium]|nr:hypothetical protein [Candidatus Sumerlaeia bacterium]